MSPFLTSLVAWANVPFTAVLGVALGFSLLQATGLLGLLAGGDHGDGDGDADGHAEVDGHAEGHLEGDVDGDVDAEADADTDAHADASPSETDHAAPDAGGGSHGSSAGFFESLGVGKVPLSIVWQTFAVGFGVTGIALNTVFLGVAEGLPAYTLIWTLPVSSFAGLLFTRKVGSALARALVPPTQQATSRRELVGHSGVVISSKVDQAFGEIRVKDKTGHTLHVICRLREGEPPVAEGREVVIVDHDRPTDRLYVTALDSEELPPTGPSPRRLA